VKQASPWLAPDVGHAALAGQGLALVEQRFVRDALASGQLIEPFSLSPLCLGQYRLRWTDTALRRHARQCRDWLRRQTAR
jgi:DNA-binding transcriptional LysR family regulator